MALEEHVAWLLDWHVALMGGYVYHDSSRTWSHMTLRGTRAGTVGGTRAGIQAATRAQQVDVDEIAPENMF